MFEREGNGGWRKEGQVGVTSPGALSSGSCQKAAENSKGVAEEFHEGIICKGMSGLKGQRVGTVIRDRLSGQELWPSGEGQRDGTASKPSEYIFQGSDMVTFGFLKIAPASVEQVVDRRCDSPGRSRWQPEPAWWPQRKRKWSIPSNHSSVLPPLSWAFPS